MIVLPRSVAERIAGAFGDHPDADAVTVRLRQEHADTPTGPCKDRYLVQFVNDQGGVVHSFEHVRVLTP